VIFLHIDLVASKQDSTQRLADKEQGTGVLQVLAFTEYVFLCYAKALLH
jgi:hypothetical protein